MLSSLLLKILDPVADDLTNTLLTEDYPNNPYVLVTAAQKLTMKALVETTMRAETGKALSLPYGSNINLSQWEKILLNPRQLFELPTESLNEINTSVVIGKNAKKPLKLDMPIMVTGMSYGGSLSLRMKMAIAKGTAMVGTSTNTGESAVADEVRQNAKYLIGQYNRGGLMTSDEMLGQLDAIEIQLGQGAWGGAVESTKYADKIDEHLRGVWNLNEGEDFTIYSRMPKPKVNSTQDVIDLVNKLKSEYDVPIGVKIAGTDFIENELRVLSQTNADFIVIDGSEGGTAVAPPTLADNVGLPTLHTLSRTIAWLNKNNIRDKFDIIVAGGLSTPGHFLKALALGANAVYIGSVAVFAVVQSQSTKVTPQSVPTQIALHDGKYTDELDIDEGANSLKNYLNSCMDEIKLALQATGKKYIGDLSKEDLVTVDKDLAEFLQIRYAASAREV